MSLFEYQLGRVAGPGLTRALGLGVAVVVLVAACSGSGATATPVPATAAPTEAPSVAPSAASEAPSVAPSSAASAAAETYEVDLATGSVGSYLTGEAGKTLYTFKKDTTPGTSACTGDCATNWPPFTATASDTLKAGAGVTGALAMISRPDGSSQVTYKGAPLYYFAGDKAAGDTTGQGFGGFWFVAAP